MAFFLDRLQFRFVDCVCAIAKFLVSIPKFTLHTINSEGYYFITFYVFYCQAAARHVNLLPKNRQLVIDVHYRNLLFSRRIWLGSGTVGRWPDLDPAGRPQRHNHTTGKSRKTYIKGGYIGGNARIWEVKFSDGISIRHHKHRVFYFFYSCRIFFIKISNNISTKLFFMCSYEHVYKYIIFF